MGFVVPLEDVSVHEKKQAKFECIITKDVSKVMWFRGSDIITPSPKYELIDDGKKHMLIINSCEFDDESQYSIEVLDQKSSARLTVEGMYGIAAQEDLNPSFCSLLTVGLTPTFCLLTSCIPGMRLKFTKPLQNQTQKEGCTALFELELTHENVPVVWYRNEVKLHVSRTVLTYVDGVKHSLEMRMLSLDDTCQIKAEAKGINSMAKLTVIGNEHLTSMSSDSCLQSSFLLCSPFHVTFPQGLYRLSG